MLNRSSSYILSIIIKLLLLLAVAKLISLSIWWFLPSDGVELDVEKNYKPSYKRINFKNMVDKTSKKVINKAPKVKTTSGISITNMILKGLYGLDDEGYAILALKSASKKTSIISVGEKFSGYTLKAILSDSVVFTKGSKEYILEIAYVKDIASKQKKIISRIEDDRPKHISRMDIINYTRNPKKLWSEISIKEVKNGSRINGFKITRIKRGSRLSQLGLKKGDIIKSVNNRELKSYKEAMNLYKNLNKLRDVKVLVLRNNKEKELVYEIN